MDHKRKPSTHINQNIKCCWAVVVHVFNPSTLGCRGEWISVSLKPVRPTERVLGQPKIHRETPSQTITITVEAEKCRSTSTLSDSQSVWRLPGIIARPNSGGDYLVILKLRQLNATLTGGQDIQNYFCSLFCNCNITQGRVVFSTCDLEHLHYLENRTLMI